MESAEQFSELVLDKKVVGVSRACAEFPLPQREGLVDDDTAPACGAPENRDQRAVKVVEHGHHVEALATQVNVRSFKVHAAHVDGQSGILGSFPADPKAL